MARSKKQYTGIVQHYIVIDQKEKNSIYGGKYVEIQMIGAKDYEMYKTYIDYKNYNVDNWQYIINNPEHGFIIKGLKVKNEEKRVLNADSKPIIEWEHEDKAVVLRELEDFIKEQQVRNAPNRFWNIFDVQE